MDTEHLLQNHKTKGKEKRQTKQTITEVSEYMLYIVIRVKWHKKKQKEKMMNRLQINS